MWAEHKTSIIVGTVLACLFAAFWFIQSFALVVFISLLLAILLTPIVDRLDTRGVARALASFIVLALFTAFGSAIFFHISKTFLPSLARFTTELPAMLADFSLSVDLPEAMIEELNAAIGNMTAFSLDALHSSLNILLSLFTKILDIVVILFVTFYLLKDAQLIEHFLIGLFPKQDKRRISALFDAIIQSLSRYIRGQFIICLLTGALVLLYFTLAGLPYAPIFAVLSGIGEFIPVVGPTIASFFGSAMALTVSLPAAAQTGVFYLCLTQINHNVIFPYLIGKSLHLHPIAVLLTILLGGQLLGVVGMFLAVPCLVILKLVIEDIAKHS